ncbi:hypothetical protein QBC35DRAFT_161993 [Podospora australis]|uniref:Uncharacterized protein n=1 Tax=Podospora australis TaxID=1536484 RepID=A0AAN6X2V9_9PEZI|nr:hypothetical protein QBC35DRAFT_161993 [Podospora australis]
MHLPIRARIWTPSTCSGVSPSTTWTRDRAGRMEVGTRSTSIKNGRMGEVVSIYLPFNINNPPSALVSLTKPPHSPSTPAQYRQASTALTQKSNSCWFAPSDCSYVNLFHFRNLRHGMIWRLVCAQVHTWLLTYLLAAPLVTSTRPLIPAPVCHESQAHNGCASRASFSTSPCALSLSLSLGHFESSTPLPRVHSPPDQHSPQGPTLLAPVTGIDSRKYTIRYSLILYRPRGPLKFARHSSLYIPTYLSPFVFVQRRRRRYGHHLVDL